MCFITLYVSVARLMLKLSVGTNKTTFTKFNAKYKLWFNG